MAATMGEAHYVLQRSRHSAGEVSCLLVDELLALPAHAEIAVRYESAEDAAVAAPGCQAFLMIRKI